LKDGGVVPVGMTTLLDETNQPFAAGLSIQKALL